MLFGRRADRRRIAIVRDGRRITIENLRWRGDREMVLSAESFTRACNMPSGVADQDYYLAHYVAERLDGQVVVPKAYQERLDQELSEPGVDY